MTVMNFDLEDGLPPVSFDLNPNDAERFAAFMAECREALEAAPTPPAQAFPDVPPNIQNIMWEVFEYANIKEGFNSLEGEERVKRRSQLFEQDAKIRRMLLNLPKNEDGQEGESVAEIVCEDMGRPFSAMQIMAHFYKDTPPVGTKLYTRPDNSELRKAAEEVLNIIHERNLYSAPLPRIFWDALDNLRAALEKK